MEETANRVLLLGSAKSYMLLSIKSQLEEFKFEVNLCEAKLDTVSKAGKNYNAIVIYSDDNIAKDQQLLVYIKDLSTEEDIPVFLIGYAQEIGAIKGSIPGHLIAKEYLRPVNVSELAKGIMEYFDDHVQGNKKKILVVDDSGAALRMVKEWLDPQYQVILANSGMMAIKYLTQDNPDLVLLDYEMPVCDGKQVLEMIRSESDYSTVPVIFLTSKGDRESIMEVMKLRPDGYLLKTMAPADIVKAIDDFFEKRKAMK